MCDTAASSGSWESALDLLGHPGTPVRKHTPFKDSDVNALLAQGEVRRARSRNRNPARARARAGAGARARTLTLTLTHRAPFPLPPPPTTDP